MDGVKENVADPQVNPSIRRGMNLIVMDGPGQGMSNIRKIRVTHDNYERAASAVIDYLVSRPEVDPRNILVLGRSMGSFWAVRTAAHDHRIKAVAAGPSACFGNKTAIFEQASPRFKQVFMYMAGVHEEEKFDRTVAAHMDTMGYGKDIRCPTLLVQGEFDPLSPLEDAQDLFEELQVPKEMWILEDDFHGGSISCDGLGGMPGYPFMMDWLRKVAENGLPQGYARIKWIPLKSGAGPYDQE